jgi:ABC-type branched-subunit amino acid transport system substrate-binding protein
LALAISVVHATDYYIKAILPQTGSMDASRQVQWGQVAKFAAQEVTAEWNDGDNLFVEVEDSMNKMSTAISLAAEATMNASVMAVVTGDISDDLVAEMSRLLQVYDVRRFVPTPLMFPAHYSSQHLSSNRKDDGRRRTYPE